MGHVPKYLPKLVYVFTKHRWTMEAIITAGGMYSVDLPQRFKLPAFFTFKSSENVLNKWNS